MRAEADGAIRHFVPARMPRPPPELMIELTPSLPSPTRKGPGTGEKKLPMGIGWVEGDRSDCGLLPTVDRIVFHGGLGRVGSVLLTSFALPGASLQARPQNCHHTRFPWGVMGHRRSHSPCASDPT